MSSTVERTPANSLPLSTTTWSGWPTVPTNRSIRVCATVSAVNSDCRKAIMTKPVRQSMTVKTLVFQFLSTIDSNATPIATLVDGVVFFQCFPR